LMALQRPPQTALAESTFLVRSTRFVADAP
jgi:hypothetical protein